MRTDPWYLWCALLVAGQLLAVGWLPLEVVRAWGAIFLVIGIAAVTLLAWIATDGRRPTLAVGGAMLLCFLAARGQAEFVAGALAAIATGFLLFKMRGRACAESSQP